MGVSAPVSAAFLSAAQDNAAAQDIIRAKAPLRRYPFMHNWSRLTVVLLVLTGLTVVAPAQSTEERRENQRKAQAYWRRADARRRSKRYEDARKDYEKAAEAWGAANNRRFAEVTRQMVELCEAMPINVRKLRDGTYEGTALGHQANMTVSVTIRDGRIRGFEVKEQRESRPLKALEIVPRLIFRKQTPSVDAVSGATVTSYGLMTAAQRALEKAKPEAGD